MREIFFVQTPSLRIDPIKSKSFKKVGETTRYGVPLSSDKKEFQIRKRKKTQQVDQTMLKIKYC